LHIDTDGFQNIGASNDADVNIEVDVFANPDRASVKTFAFRAQLAGIGNVVLGPRLMSTYIALPCDVTLAGGPEIELTAPVQVHGRRLHLQGTTLVLRALPTTKGDGGVLMAGDTLESSITETRIVCSRERHRLCNVSRR
jgi:hypothetical protein